ncbi:hypothetical protein BDZ90DRAFT_217498, partial [Jaminaea rosea]
RRYELVIRQQPQRGRQCALGSRERRPIDPPPICQLVIYRPDGTSASDPAGSSPSFSAPVAPTPTPTTRRLEGKTYSSGHLVKDLDGQTMACFFVFPDLSIKDEGMFALRFNLIRGLVPSSSSSPSLAGGIVTSVTSVIFENYSPRRFPGSLESTPLTRTLAGQGVLAPIRNYTTAAAASAPTSASASGAGAVSATTSASSSRRESLASLDKEK